MAIANSINKIGASRGEAKRRVWLEGDRVLAAGFAVGMFFTRAWDEKEGTLTLTLGEGATRATRGKVSGKGDRPILDIVGEKVFEVFGKHCDKVEVSYAPGRIVVRRSS